MLASPSPYRADRAAASRAVVVETSRSEAHEREAHALGALPQRGAVAFLRLQRERLVARLRSSEAPSLIEVDVPGQVPATVLADLRSDHAGEVGAVQIYRGMLAISRDEEVRAFASSHLLTELEHLRSLQQWLPPVAQSRLLPLWRLAGWLTGALPAWFGARAVYVTVAAVESFVDRHYAGQIERLSAFPDLEALRDTLAACRHDEIAHRDDALARLPALAGPVARAWSVIVVSGSQLAVCASRRL